MPSSYNIIPVVDLPITTANGQTYLVAANMELDKAVRVYLPELSAASALIASAIDGVVGYAEQQADALLAGLGYLPPVAYAQGLSVNTTRYTVTYNGITYAPVAGSLPFTTTTNFDASKWRVIQGVTFTDLASPSGASIVGFNQTSTSVTRQILGKVREAGHSITDEGAFTAATDNLGFIDAAIAKVDRGDKMIVPSGTFKVGSRPSNVKGVRYDGPGKIVAPIPVSQINSYRYKYPIAINKEYLWRIYQVLNNTNRKINVYLYGDSTVEGGYNYIDDPFFLQKLLPDMASARGCQNFFSVTNRGVGGSNLSTWNPLPDVGTNPDSSADFIILKCGINDAFPEETRLQNFESRLRSGLAAIRAKEGGSVNSLAILLVGPNAVWDMEFDARNTRWFESLRSIFEAAAADYKCAYFDAYAYLQDASAAPGAWLDLASNGSGTGLHPTNVGQSWIWGAVMDFVMGESEMLRYKSNQFHNKSQYRGWPTAKNPPFYYPNNYPPGITMEIALAADGFPITGALKTEKNVDGYLTQTLTPVDGSYALFIRTSRSVDGYYSPWKGTTADIEMASGWSNFGGVYRTAAVLVGHENKLTLSGLIKPGTLSAGVTMCILPINYRPVNQHIMLTASSSGPCEVEVLATGEVKLRSFTGTPTYVSLSGLSFIP